MYKRRETSGVGDVRLGLSAALDGLSRRSCFSVSVRRSVTKALLCLRTDCFVLQGVEAAAKGAVKDDSSSSGSEEDEKMGFWKHMIGGSSVIDGVEGEKPPSTVRFCTPTKWGILTQRRGEWV